VKRILILGGGFSGVEADAFQALFTTLPPLRGFVESLIEARR
jgi:hypothetical protein